MLSTNELIDFFLKIDDFFTTCLMVGYHENNSKDRSREGI